jgi:hypothetical protein
MGMVIGMIITAMGIGMIIDGLTAGTMAITTIGMIMDPDGLTVLAVVPVGTRATERMSPHGMGITLTPTSATPQGTAGIHAPIIIMGIKVSPYRRQVSDWKPMLSAAAAKLTGGVSHRLCDL